MALSSLAILIDVWMLRANLDIDLVTILSIYRKIDYLKVPMRPTPEIRGPRISGFHVFYGPEMVGAVNISTTI